MQLLSSPGLKENPNLEISHEALDQMHKETAEGTCLCSTWAEWIHYVQPKGIPLKICKEDCMMISTHSKMEHKLQPKWRGPIRATGEKSYLIFVIENMIHSRQLVVHAQRMCMLPSPCKVSKYTSFLRAAGITLRFNTNIHLIDAITKAHR